jgi:catechol 2,3-dioxygenase-like lactoylglutathione lyase family enzyme
MKFLEIGVLVLAALVALGRKPLMARTPGRLLGLTLAVAAAAAAVYDAARGGWIGGSILLTAALWLAQSTFGRRRVATGGMGQAEAASILGVAQSADREEVEAAYRRLMFRVHPDHGGAAGLAAQLNAARSVLLDPPR